MLWISDRREVPYFYQIALHLSGFFRTKSSKEVHDYIMQLLRIQIHLIWVFKMCDLSPLFGVKWTA